MSSAAVVINTVKVKTSPLEIILSKNMVSCRNEKNVEPSASRTGVDPGFLIKGLILH